MLSRLFPRNHKHRNIRHSLMNGTELAMGLLTSDAQRPVPSPRFYYLGEDLSDCTADVGYKRYPYLALRLLLVFVDEIG